MACQWQHSVTAFFETLLGSSPSVELADTSNRTNDARPLLLELLELEALGLEMNEDEDEIEDDGEAVDSLQNTASVLVLSACACGAVAPCHCTRSTRLQAASTWTESCVTSTSVSHASDAASGGTYFIGSRAASAIMQAAAIR